MYTVASVVVVLLGVSLTVGDALSASAAGVAVGAASVVTTCLQQQGTARLQLDYGMTSKAFVAQTFYWQALVLLGLGPLVDTALLGVSPLAWPGFRPAGRPQILWLAASCVLAVAANFSQVMCFRTLSPTSFQVLGTAKTVLVLVGGWLLFAHADLAARTLWGQAIAVAGMALYGHSKLLDGAAAVVAAPALPDKAAAGETVEGGALAGPATIVVAP